MTKNTASGVNFPNIFGNKIEQLLHEEYLMPLMTIAFGKSALKYGAQHKSCSLKSAEEFQQKC
jgi:hypothetical protein